MSECTERSTTVALASGTLRSQDIARAQAHLVGCEMCRLLVSEAGAAPTVRLAESDVIRGSAPATPVDATMTSPNRRSEPPERASRPWIGRYRVVEKLGEGGMGAVYAAEDPELDRRVAIKLLHLASETASARLVREARALAKLRHPNVVTIYEVGRDAGDAFVAMELVQGVTLRDWLLGEHSIDERLDALIQAGRGLAAAHAEGLIHRDFKPENVMVGADGRVQVLDFGLAKSAAQVDEDEPASTSSSSGKRPSGKALDELTRTGTLLGTPAYMAPEQFEAAATDARTDQFAYCVALFEVLHGFRPFAGASHVELGAAVTSGTMIDRPLSDKVPPHVQAAILRGLSVDPAARFPDMSSLLAALPAKRPQRRQRPQRPQRPQRWVVAIVAAAAVIAGGAAVWIATRSSSSSAKTTTNPDEALFTRSGVPAPQPTPLKGDSFKVTVHRLSNGLTVWISPNRKSPRVEARLVVRAGSRDANIGGLAHMVEHMTFMGTARIGTLDFEHETVHLTKLRSLYAAHAKATTDAERTKLLAEIDAETVASSQYAIPSELTDTASALGIRDYRATTDYDSTVFTADVPSNKFALWAKLEGERLVDPVFRSFHIQAGVVFDEIHQRRSSGATQALYDSLLGAAFEGHPYSLSPSGSFADIVAEPFNASEAFFATWYVPNNAALMLAGDIDPEQAIPVLEREFARWRPRSFPNHEVRPIAPLAGEIKRTVKGMDMPLAVIGWHTVPYGHADADAIVALGALIDYLGQQQAGRARMQTVSWPLVEGGLLTASAVPVAGHTQADAIAALDDVIHAIQAGQFSQDTLAAVLLNYTRSLARAHDTNSVRLDRMQSSYLAGRGWAYTVARAARVAALSKADLVRVANTYLTNKRVTITSEVGPYEMPAVQAPRITPIAPKQKTSSPFAARLLAEETVEIPPRFVSEGRDYHVSETPVGPLISVANTEDDEYVLHLRWDFGSRQMPLLCAALHALDHAGIGAADVAARHARWFARAQSASVSCYADIVDVEITGAEATFDASWEDVEQWLTGGGITDATWQAAVSEYLDYRTWTRSGDTLIEAIDRYAAYGAASLFFAGASTEALRRATARDARDVLQTLVTTRRTIAYFGPRKTDAIRLPASLAVSRTQAPRAPLRLAPIKTTRIVALDTGANRAVNATIRFPLGHLDPARLALARVFANYLSDNGGVLWDAFRTVRGITFSGGTAWIDEALGPDDDASLMIRFSTSAEQLAKALELALSIAREPKLDREQVELARRRTEEAFRAAWIAPRDLPSTVAYWRAQGNQADPRGPLFDHTLRTNERDLSKLVTTLAPAYITITGDMSAIDRARLQTIGAVETVALPALFAP